LTKADIGEHDENVDFATIVISRLTAAWSQQTYSVLSRGQPGWRWRRSTAGISRPADHLAI